MPGIWPPQNPQPTPGDGVIYLAIFLGFALGVLFAAALWTAWRFFT